MLWSASQGNQAPLHEGRDAPSNQPRGHFDRSNSGGSSGGGSQPANRELTHAAEMWAQFNAEKERELERERDRPDARHRAERARKDSDMSGSSSRRSEDRELIEVKSILSHPPVS